ncbi:MAG: phosphoribosylglycinamide formyltransferase [Halanaerobiales bacterium]|nr:phosphoribosylglycinamide formyltransferase [Halanaerobiales bacterium]
MFQLAVLASGRGSNLKSIIDKLHLSNKNIKITCVISNKKEAKALKIAKKYKIPFYLIDENRYNEKEYEEKLIKTINLYNIDLIVLAGYMKILSPKFVNSFKDSIINIHPSLLPSFPGLHAQKQAIDYGVKISGCTVHYINNKVDAGPIIKQKAVKVEKQDDEASLSKKILKYEHQLLPATIELIAQGKVQINKYRTVSIKE